MIGALIIAAAIGAAPPVQPTVMMREGDIAPYPGWLVEGERLQEALQAQSDLLRCRDDLLTSADECSADALLCADRVAACDRQVDELKDAGRVRLAPPVVEWYESPAFVATVAVIAAVAVTSGAWWAATR